MTRLFFPLTTVSLGVLLLLMPRASTAQDSSTELLFFEERSAVLGEQFRDILDRSPETKEQLLEAISDLRAIAKTMEAEKSLVIGAFPHGVQSKEVLVLVNLVWELGYQAGTAEMLADEWERLLASPLMQCHAGDTDQ